MASAQAQAGSRRFSVGLLACLIFHLIFFHFFLMGLSFRRIAVSLSLLVYRSFFFYSLSHATITLTNIPHLPPTSVFGSLILS